MGRKGRKLCVALLAIAMVMCVTGTAFAAPMTPAVYDGTAVYNDVGQTPVAAGLLRAYINDEQVSKDIDRNSNINNGAFMNFIADINDDKGDADYTKIGKPVVFKVVIGGQEYLATAAKPVVFDGDVNENVNLTVQTTPQPVKPTLQTASATDIAITSATLNGNITSSGNAAITEYGFKWGTGETSLTNTVKVGQADYIGTFTHSLTGLTADTTYFYQAYATNSAGTAYGEVKSFTTEALPIVKPTLQTASATDIAITSATLNGNITSNGNAAITEYGFNWGTGEASLTNTEKVGQTDFTGAFNNQLTGLTAGTTYYYQAYAINSAGTATGEIKSFTTTTAPAPAVTLSLPSRQAFPGDVIEVPVTLTSQGGIAGIQFDMSTCADLLEYQGIDAGDLTADFSVTYNEANGRVIIYSTSAAAIPEGTGTIAVLQYKVKDGAQPGQSCALQLTGVELTDEEGGVISNANLTLTDGSFTVQSSIMGDINGDGAVTVADVVKAVNFALEKNNPTDKERYAADVNGDGRISIADVVAIVNLSLAAK